MEQIVEYPHQTLAMHVHISWGFQDFLICFGKVSWFDLEYFLSFLNSPYLIFQLLFCKSNVNKAAITLFSLKFIFSYKSYIKSKKLKLVLT